MKRKIIAYTFASLVLPAALFVAVQFRVPARAADQKADPAQKQSASADNIDLEYAKTYLALIQNEVKRVEEMNKRVRGTVPTLVLDELQECLIHAQTRVALIEHPDQAADALVKLAQQLAKHAKTRLDNVERANRVSPGTFPQTEVERLKLAARLAELRAQRAKQLEAASSVDRLAWEVEQLHEQLARLRIATSTLISRE